MITWDALKTGGGPGVRLRKPAKGKSRAARTLQLGSEFIDENGDGPGVRLKKSTKVVGAAKVKNATGAPTRLIALV